MTSEARVIGYELLKTGTLVSFRVVTEEVLNAPADDAEFGSRVQLKFVAEDEEEGEEDDVAENTAEWGSFGFMFVLGVLSFAEAKPRNASVLEYEEKDEFRLADLHRTPALRAWRAALRCRLYPRAPDQDSDRGAIKWNGHARDRRSRQVGTALA